MVLPSSLYFSYALLTAFVMTPRKSDISKEFKASAVPPPGEVTASLSSDGDLLLLFTNIVLPKTVWVTSLCAISGVAPNLIAVSISASINRKT